MGLGPSWPSASALCALAALLLMLVAPSVQAQDLNSLSLSRGTLSPAFASATTNYTAAVGFGVTSVTVTPAFDPGATATVNGVPANNGTPSGAIALAIGNNVITITVTAPGGVTQKTYSVTVTRAGSPDASLAALSPSNGTLTPAFATGITNYNASVNNATNIITVTPTANDGNARITVNGFATTSGTASRAISLVVGSNIITVQVTAQDGVTQRSYTITVTRAASSNTNLSALSTSSGTLNPLFNSATTGYTVGIGAAVTSINVTPVLAAGVASVTVNGNPVASGAASGPIAMNPGDNTIVVVVTAQNGATKAYTLTVTRAIGSSNADLSGLSTSSGTLSPVFAAGSTVYTASVSNAVSSVTVVPTVADANASVTVNGVAVASGTASGPIALNFGANAITVIATAQNGDTRTYTITVTRLAVPVGGAAGVPTLSQWALILLSLLMTGTAALFLRCTGALHR